MSEDRHTFSEPRPIPGLELPTWDVDIFRDGVPEPIFTLRIDAKALPPRKSKKKKVVWKLPDSVDQTPRFGIDEKRRLLDLFKNLKKERRKSQKRGSNLNIDASGIAEDAKSDDDFNEPETTNNNNNIQSNDGENRLADAMGSMALGQGSSRSEPPPQPPRTNGKQSNNNPTPKPVQPPGLSNGGMFSSTTAPIPPGIQPPPPGNRIHRNTSLDNGGNGNVSPTKPPPGMNRARSEDGIASQQQPPPPGLAPGGGDPPPSNRIHEPSNVHNPQHLQQQPPSQQPLPPPETQQQQQQQQQQQHAPPPPPPPQQQQQQQIQAPQPAPVSAPLPSLNPLLNIPLQQFPPPARYMTCPPGMHPDIFAQQVANLYITLLQSGQVDELLMYYTMTAQKSLSLKSAKSICQTPTEMKTQLTSLVGCVFAVQGITVHTQCGFNNSNSLLLIWSGICQLQGQQQHGFCQTIVLVPFPTTTTTTTGGVGIEENNGLQYQIQNDALVLLTNE